MTVFDYLKETLEHNGGLTPENIRTVLLDRWPLYFGDEAEVIFATLAVDMAVADAGERLYESQTDADESMKVGDIH